MKNVQASPLILASSSPRRRQLLENLGIPLIISPSDANETPLPNEDALHLAPRLARAKGEASARQQAWPTGAIILAADTIVALDGKLLGKPETPEDAHQMLRMLSGKAHSVVSGVYVCRIGSSFQETDGDRFGNGQIEAFSKCIHVETKVFFRSLTNREIDWYISTGEPMDKAGSYAIQGIAGAFVDAIQGSHSNVIGLPLAETLALLQQAGFSMPWGQH